MSSDEISRSELQELVRAYYEAETNERRAIWHREGLRLPGGAGAAVRWHVEPPEITFHHVPCELATTYEVGLQYKPQPEPGMAANMQISGPWMITDEQKLKRKAYERACDTAENATHQLSELHQLARAAKRQQQRYEERAAGYRKEIARLLCSWSYVTGEDSIAARVFAFQHAKPEELYEHTYSPVPEAFTAQVVERLKELLPQLPKYASAACFWYMVAAYSEVVEASLLETGRLPEMGEQAVDWEAEPIDGRAKATEQQKRAAVRYYYEADAKASTRAEALGQTLEFLLSKGIELSERRLRDWIDEHAPRF